MAKIIFTYLKNNKMKAEDINVMIACEESQAVCKAFRKLGFNAYSNDIKECSGGYPEWHLQMDSIEALKIKNWDLVIAHPPCTFLSFVSKRHWTIEDKVKQRIDAAKFFIDLYFSNTKYVCVENPSGIMINIYRKADQEIHPYYFGDAECKRTMLWLKNLPLLQYTKQDNLFENKTSVNKPLPLKTWINKKGQRKAEYYTYAKNATKRSKTFPGIAKAMAEQWGTFLLENAT